MRGLLSRSWVGLACLILIVSGCDKDPFGPPSRSRPLPSVAQPEEAKPNYLIFVVPRIPTGDLEVWGYRAQHEANDKRAIFRIMGPAPTETAGTQAQVVQRAVADGASALIVYPGDSPELPKALAEAESKGVPVVLLDRSVTAPEGSKPFTVVEFAPFEATAKQIVAATIEDLKKAKQPVNGTAIVLADKVVDRTSGQRVDALKAAAEAAGFRQAVVVPIDGTDQAASRKAVIEAVKAQPDASVVLTDDGEGLVVGAEARAELKGKPIIFVGGYTDYRTSPVVTPPERESCHVQGRFTELGGLAVLTALAKLKGEKVGEHAYLQPKFTKTEGAVSSEAEPNKPFPEVRKHLPLGDPTKNPAPPLPEKKEEGKPQ